MYAADLTVDACIDALSAFLTPFVGGAEIVRAQANRVPMPSTPCVVLTELIQVDFSMPVVVPDDIGVLATITGPKRIDIQIDFYAPNAGDLCAAVKTVYRSPYAVAQFPAGIAPLYCDDGRQTALVTGEQQYESRWTLTASMQYNPSVDVPSQSASVAVMNSTTAADSTTV
jgi:hypothetical protein